MQSRSRAITTADLCGMHERAGTRLPVDHGGEAMLAHLVEDAARADAEQPRGARSIAAGRIERRRQDVLFAEIERAGKLPAARGEDRRHIEWTRRSIASRHVIARLARAR